MAEPQVTTVPRGEALGVAVVGRLELVVFVAPVVAVSVPSFGRQAAATNGGSQGRSRSARQVLDQVASVGVFPWIVWVTGRRRPQTVPDSVHDVRHSHS